RIADPNNANQFVYLEYRGQTHEYYDKYCGVNPGLIAYTVRTNISDGNRTAPPYEIYVHRPSGKSVSYAAIGEGQSIGNSNTASTTDAILFDVGITGVGKNSGIVVEVLGQTADQLIIKITSPNLYSATPYTVDDLGGNAVLYNKLLSQSGNGKLLYDTFMNASKLDLSYCNIDNLLFLSIFSLKNLQHLNLIGNYFTETYDFATIVATYNLQNVSLTFNTINLKKLSQSYLTNSIYDWGLQYTSSNKVVVNTSCSFMYYYTSSNKISGITINNVAVEECTSGQVKEQTLYSTGENIIKVSFKTNGLGLSTEIDSLIIAKATSLYDSAINSYKMAKDDAFPNVNTLIKIEGYSAANFDYVYTYPTTAAKINSSFTVGISYNGKTLASVTVYYSVIELKVIFGGDDPTILEVGETYTEKGITVYENNVNKNYVNATSGNCTYQIKYYYGTIDKDGTVTLGSESSINSLQKAEYLVNYIITTSFGKTYSNYYLQVIVDDNLIKPSKMNRELYNVLLGISKKEFVYKTDFSSLDYLDLSSKNLEYVNGLDLLDFKTGVIVDLSNNSLKNISEVKTLINNNSGISAVYLLYNMFNSTDIASLTNRAKYYFGMQNIKTVNLSVNQNDPVADIYNDYTAYFTFDCQNYHIQNNKLYFDSTGSFSCNFSNSTIKKTYSKIIQYIIINPKEQSTKEYSDTWTFSASQFFTIKGKDFGSLTISSNFNSLELNKIGEKIIQAVFSYGGATLTLTHSIMVVDTVKPVLSLSGNVVVYVTSLDQYIQLYGSDACYAADAYDGELEVSVTVPKMNAYGEYEVIYSAKDSSGNDKTLSRKVCVGNVELTKTQANEGYGVAFELPLRFYCFTADQFVITYKIDGDSIYRNYDSANLITINEFKYAHISIRAIHRYNTNIFKTFDYGVYVVDTIKPQVEVLGNSVLELYAGELFVDSGVKVTDNGTSDVLTLNNSSSHLSLMVEYKFKPLGESDYKIVQNIDTSLPGEYVINYVAKDKYNNIETGQRTVQIEYGPIEGIEIDQSKLLTMQSKGQKVTVKVNIISDYITEPNPTILWFVNEILYKETNGTSVEIELNETGEVVVYAQLKNGDRLYSQDITFTVYQQSAFEGVALYIVIAVVVVVIVFIVIGAVARYRRRNFY
ncbi:MAG: hypothetical protein J6Q51_03540, partial [Clostridia bacterium]|nr:hypothetical protein [Clostridia bacterium]